RWSFLFIMVCSFLLITVPGAPAADKDSCLDCHKDEAFRVQNKMLYDYYQNWKDSIHELAGVACSDCHGGNPAKADKDAAHKGNFSPLSSADRESYKLIPGRCGACHEPVLKNFRESQHYTALIKKGSGPHCVTCHGSMNAEVYYTAVVARACQECHNEYTKLSPEVVGEADKILQRINVSRAMRNWVSVYYAEKAPDDVAEINALYSDVADSWHRFSFSDLDRKSEDLLARLKSMVNKKLAERKKK
ncbi:MAG: hypothetical protein JSU90_08815, partial [Nitrospiraceae bacterium]